MARPDQEKCRLCSKLDSRKPSSVMDRMEMDAGIRTSAIIAAPTIATGKFGIMSANNDDANSKRNNRYQNRTFLLR